MNYDVFISHAGEDKEEVARPLANSLQAAGLNVWFDEFTLRVGDSLRQSIDRGLASSAYGIVILSPSFFAKKWTQEELGGLYAKEIIGDRIILPVWHDITQSGVAQASPMLADRFALLTAGGLDGVVEKLMDKVKPEWRHSSRAGHTIALSPSTIRLHTDGEWLITTPVTLTNNGNAPLYGVSVKIVIHGDGVTPESLEIDLDSPRAEIRIGDAFVAYDRTRLNGKNSAGESVVLFNIDQISPRTSRLINVSGTLAIPSTAELSVASFRTEPCELIRRRGNEFFVKLQITEIIRLTSAEAYVRPA